MISAEMSIVKSKFMDFNEYKESPIDFPLWDRIKTNHTMGSALEPWAWSKVPNDLVRQAALTDMPVRVYGLYPTNINDLVKFYEGTILHHSDFSPTPADKSFNYIRPQFTLIESPKGKMLLVAVTPGHDYVQHYAGIIRYCLHTLGKPDLLRVFHNVPYERAIADWSGLDKRFIVPNSFVVLGRVKDAQEYLCKHSDMRVINQVDSPYYTSTHYCFKEKIHLTFLGVKFSFWGDISKFIVKKICELDVKEVVYLGKLGTLRDPHDIYQSLFSPTSYITLDHLSVRHEVRELPNYIVKLCPYLDTSVHVSVPTVIGEDFTQRNLAAYMGCQSVDNEISQMAHAVEEHNESVKIPVLFASLHYASDYLRKEDELEKDIQFNLSNHRRSGAQDKIRNVVDKQMRHFLEYLDHRMGVYTCTCL